jgi:hypothetical protein
MTQQGKGKFNYPKRGHTGIIYVPADLTHDSTFPFKPGQTLTITIHNRKLIIEDGEKI